MSEGEMRSARGWALRALGRRMHTEFEIRESLKKRGFGEGVAGSVVEELAAQGYLDDHQFSMTWVKSRSLHQLHGRLRLLRDLRRKGVPDEIAESVLAETLSREEEVALAVKAARKKQRTLGKTGLQGRDALYRHLSSRGFAAGVISQALAVFTFEEEST